MSPRTTANAANAFIGRRIKELRVLNDIRQGTLCDALGVNQQQLSKYESGLDQFPSSKIITLFDALNTTPNIFFEIYEDQSSKTGFLSEQSIFLAKLLQASPPNMRATITGLISSALPQRKRRPKS